MIRAARGDPGSLEKLVGRHAIALDRRFAAQIGRDAIAHELMAESFAQVWLRARRFRGVDENAGAAWLHGIARSLLRR